MGLWLIAVIGTPAALVVKVAPAKLTGSKAVIGLDLENTYSQKIKSVRAAIFLFDDHGKVVGQETRWIIGGTQDKPALAPATQAKYDFVVTMTKPFTRSQLIVTRIALDDGKMGDVLKDVQIQDAGDHAPK